ncbi:MAG: Rieske 2Fe-2S domain-containing protein [Hyphomonadaceae bacterium]|nr:Rieske 2Fe-2S domain-containing protein [Hyphomonadaceae bacterium]
MSDAHYWMVAAESRALHAGAVIGRRICNVALVLYRDPDGTPIAAPDRCLHRCGKLSAGTARRGVLKCPYHGWAYGAGGRVVAIPSEDAAGPFRLPVYETCERDGYVYVRLDRGVESAPFAMPHYRARGFGRVRLVNVFENTVTNCAENFVDVPHTVSVHPGIFRQARAEKINATVAVERGEVRVEYFGERTNLGWFAFALNPRGLPVRHIDRFIAPNITHVRYEIGRSVFLITSQSVPETATRTRVHTELAWRLGALTPFAAPFVRIQGQRVIDQDKRVLADQMDVIADRPGPFIDTSADLIHAHIHALRAAVEAGEDPAALPSQRSNIEFYV